MSIGSSAANLRIGVFAYEQVETVIFTHDRTPLCTSHQSTRAEESCDFPCWQILRITSFPIPKSHRSPPERPGMLQTEESATRSCKTPGLLSDVSPRLENVILKLKERHRASNGHHWHDSRRLHGLMPFIRETMLSR